MPVCTCTFGAVLADACPDSPLEITVAAASLFLDVFPHSASYGGDWLAKLAELSAVLSRRTSSLHELLYCTR